MEIDSEALKSLDDQVEFLHAVAHEKAPPSDSLANPHAFVCSDGRVYWVKREAQQGLSAELIAGRLARTTGTGPDARVVHVSEDALPWHDHQLATDLSGRLTGVCVGIADVPAAANFKKELPQLLGGRTLKPSEVDAASRALVVAFHTWLHVRDTQALITLPDGRLHSADHGDCFGDLSTRNPSLVAMKLPCVQDESNIGRQAALVEAAADAIEAVTDEQLLRATSRIPDTDSPAWNASQSRRLEVARWLSDRRGKVREVLLNWVSS